MGLFHLSPIALFFALVIGHALGDYPLQGDFLAKAKNHTAPIPGVPWYQALTAHAAIQAGIVWLLTGSSELALLEFVCHWCIDRWKCGMTSPFASVNASDFDLDQLLHVICKAVWILVAVLTP
jgi:hypothetical protein